MQDDENHDGLLTCKEELWWDTDEDTDAELAGNSEVKEGEGGGYCSKGQGYCCGERCLYMAVGMFWIA